MKTRFYVGILFLLLQVGGIVYARYTPERFFCWAPYDNHTLFEVNVTINGKSFTQQQVEERYKYKMKGWEQRSIDNIISLISQYERTYGKHDNAKVKMTYSTNGHDEKTWVYNNE